MLRDTKYCRNAEFNETKRKSKLHANRRLSKLWRKKGAKLALAGLRVSMEEAREVKLHRL